MATCAICLSNNQDNHCIYNPNHQTNEITANHHIMKLLNLDNLIDLLFMCLTEVIESIRCCASDATS